MVLTGLFVTAVSIQLFYAGYFFSRIVAPPAGRNTAAGRLSPVSVVVCAKNEAANLEKNLPAVLQQQYDAPFEVIVVDDASDDHTQQVLGQLAQKFPALKIVTIAAADTRTLKGKKYALSRGKAAAGSGWLLLTDADCAPAGKDWLRQMVLPLASGKEIVAGYGGYNPAPSLLNAFCRWETMHTFLQFSTYAWAGKPYMATGRNMACTRQILESAQKDDRWDRLSSGDDDMLVQIMGTAANVDVVCHPGSFTHSGAKHTWREWIVQKKRHLSTGKYYRRSTQYLLGGYAFSHALLWIVFSTLLIRGAGSLLIWLMAVRCAVYWGIWTVAAVRLRERNLFYWFPVFDPGWLIYNFAFSGYIFFKNRLHWK